MSDVNWGPQDATMTKTSMQLPLFAYRSMSAFYIEVYKFMLMCIFYLYRFHCFTEIIHKQITFIIIFHPPITGTC
jgi:hypothetical protein